MFSFGDDGRVGYVEMNFRLTTLQGKKGATALGSRHFEKPSRVHRLYDSVHSVTFRTFVSGCSASRVEIARSADLHQTCLLLHPQAAGAVRSSL